jgi:hypothetical protein
VALSTRVATIASEKAASGPPLDDKDDLVPAAEATLKAGRQDD